MGFGYQCHYCRDMYPVIQKLIKQNPNLRVVYKEYLLFGPMSELPASAALAAIVTLTKHSNSSRIFISPPAENADRCAQGR